MRTHLQPKDSGHGGDEHRQADHRHQYRKRLPQTDPAQGVYQWRDGQA